MVKIAGGKAGSVDRLKKEMEKSQGGRTWIRGLKEDEDLTVRFLTEPDEWYSYREHYSEDFGFFPCIGRDNECPGCHASSEKVRKTSRRYLANALEVETGQVIPLRLALDLANRLVARYERNDNTIIDRDYTLHRMGRRLDTSYDVTPEDKSAVDLSRYKLIDLEGTLQEQYLDAFDIDDAKPDDQDTSGPYARDTEPDVDRDEVPSEPSTTAEQDDDDGYLTEEQALQMGKDELKALADRLGIKVDGRWSVEKMVDTIFENAE